MSSSNLNLYLCLTAVTYKNGKVVAVMNDSISSSRKDLSRLKELSEDSKNLTALSSILLKNQRNGLVFASNLSTDQRILLRETLQELLIDLRSGVPRQCAASLSDITPNLTSLDTDEVYDQITRINL